MQRHRSIIILTIALALTVPSFATAEWAGRGFYEPDTKTDIESGFMFTDEDTSTDAAIRQVYFSAYSEFEIAGNNPNVAALKTNFIAPAATSFNAFLGVWKDCNGDGYIGHAEGALLEYRAELLLDSTICPETSTSLHRLGEWVYEFRWIGPDAATRCGQEDDGNDYDDNPFNLVDNCARVWGDIGLPDSAGEVTCPINPQPRGTFQSTGGLIRYADCFANYRVYDAAGMLAPLDGTAGLQFSFSDTTREEPAGSASVLNQKNPYGDPSGESMAVVFDCSAPTVVRDPTSPGEGQRGELRYVGVRDPTGLVTNQSIPGVANVTLINGNGYLITNLNNVSDDEGVILSFGTPTVPTLNTDGSPAGTVNETLEGSALGDCDRDQGTGTNSELIYATESDFEPAAPRRAKNDLAFAFSETSPSGSSPYAGAGQLGDSAPFLLGSTAGRAGTLNFMGWSGSPYMAASRNPIIRTDDFSPKGAQPFTFYATVGSEAIGKEGLHMPAGPATGVYGSSNCSGTTATTGYWECDPSKWYLSGGQQVVPVEAALVGAQYNLLDVDCYEITVGSTVQFTPAGNICDR